MAVGCGDPGDTTREAYDVDRGAAVDRRAVPELPVGVGAPALDAAPLVSAQVWLLAAIEVIVGVVAVVTGATGNARATAARSTAIRRRR